MLDVQIFVYTDLESVSKAWDFKYLLSMYFFYNFDDEIYKQVHFW